MTNPTSNFGWQMPTSTDLVTDLPADFEVFGQAVDTSMADLKGGTTGQVLSKASNTNMDFTWVTTDDANAIQNSIVDAKGDLVAASANDTPARLAVGANGETLVADSSTATGLRYQGSQAAGKNILINGNFDIWQRGTSFASTAGYFADRWTNSSAYANVTASRQSTGAADGSQYYLRLTSTAGTSYWSCYQYIESSQIAAVWGTTTTLSVKLRRNSTFNSTSVSIFVQKSATVDAGAGASWTDIGSRTNVALASIPTGTTSADWYLASGQFVIPNDGTANSVRVVVEYNGAAQNGSILEFSQFQLALGLVPTTFTRAGGAIQQELANCQRYYYRQNGIGLFSRYTLGYATGATSANIIFPFPVTMRTAPSAVETTTASLYRVNDGITGTALTAFTIDQPTLQNCNLAVGVAAGLTQYRPYTLESNNSTATYLGFSAEL